MKLVDNKVEEYIQEPGIEGVYSAIASAARICYQTDKDKMKLSPKDFVEQVLLNNGHCYTGESEVLTENGWVKWKNYNNERVAVVNEETQFIGWEMPSKIIHQKYSGTFYDYKDIGIEVTDGHRMFGMFQSDYVKNGRQFKPQIFSCNSTYHDANNRLWTNGERIFRVKTNCAYRQNLIPFYQLVGFWLGDGFKESILQNGDIVKFHLKKERKINYIKELSKQLNYVFEEKIHNKYIIHSKELHDYILNNCINNNEKFLPLNLNKNLDIIHSIFDGLINSDGTIKEKHHNQISFSNTNKSIINWMLTYGVLVGYNLKEMKPKITLKNTIYGVLFLKYDNKLVNDSRKKESKVELIQKTDTVYCVSVSTGLIIVRGTSGQTLICGNSRPLEFGTVYLKIPSMAYEEPRPIDSRQFGKYEKYLGKPLWTHINGLNQDGNWYITTNMRVIMQGDYSTDKEAWERGYDKNWLQDVYDFWCEPTEFHDKRRTFTMWMSRGCTDDNRTHIAMSSICESTRFCNYSKGKFGNEMTFIKPYWIREETIQEWIKQEENNAITTEYFSDVMLDEQEFNLRHLEAKALDRLKDDEDIYLEMATYGLQPQQLKRWFPLGAKAELRLCAFDDAWQNFFWRRCDDHADPECQKVANQIRDLY